MCVCVCVRRKEAIDRLKSGKVAGVNKITAEILKYGEMDVSDIRFCMEIEVLDELKKAIIVSA